MAYVLHLGHPAFFILLPPPPPPVLSRQWESPNPCRHRLDTLLAPVARACTFFKTCFLFFCPRKKPAQAKTGHRFEHCVDHKHVPCGLLRLSIFKCFCFLWFCFCTMVGFGFVFVVLFWFLLVLFWCRGHLVMQPCSRQGSQTAEAQRYGAQLHHGIVARGHRHRRLLYRAGRHETLPLALGRGKAFGESRAPRRRGTTPGLPPSISAWGPEGLRWLPKGFPPRSPAARANG